MPYTYPIYITVMNKIEYTLNCSLFECHASCEHSMPLIIITPMDSDEFLRPTNIFGLYNPLSMTTLLHALKSKQVYAYCFMLLSCYAIYIAFIHPFKTILKNTNIWILCHHLCLQSCEVYSLHN